MEFISASRRASICSIYTVWRYNCTMQSSIQSHFWHQLSRDWVTIHGFWIDDGFIAHFDTARDYNLQFIILHTSVYSHMCTSRCSVAAFNGERSPSSGFPNYLRPQLPPSHSNSSKRLNISSSPTNSLTEWLTQSLTNQRTQFNSTFTNSTAPLITSRHGPHRKHRSITAVQLLRSWTHAYLRIFT
jgi:hypothetical protein